MSINKTVSVWLALGFLTLSINLWPQGKLEDYQRAEKFLPHNARKLVRNDRIEINWIDKSSSFWYRKDLPSGKSFLLFDPASNKIQPAFDHEKLAAAISKELGRKIEAINLPLANLVSFEPGRALSFELEGYRWTCSLKNYSLKKEKISPRPANELPSPDGRWMAVARNFNLYLRSADGSEIQLTADGQENCGYGVEAPDLGELLEAGDKPVISPIQAIWSPESKKLLTWKIDQRKVLRHHLLQFAPPGQNRAKLFSWPYELPGDEYVTQGELYVIDVPSRKVTKIQNRPLLFPFLMWNAAGHGMWSGDGKWIFLAETERGYQKVNLFTANPETGQTQLLLTEVSDTYVDPHMTYFWPIKNGQEFIWGSERDGWCHLYLYDSNGQLKNQITNGEYVVREIVRVDEAKRRVWFIAGGREPGRDPYLRHLYRVNLDGSDLKLLTPEDADHNIYFSPDGRFFVDTFSKINTIPQTVVRRADSGKLVRLLEKADISELLALGWPFPEPFSVKARDRKTDLYGAIYKPSNFDPNKKYPVIDAIYNGPQAVRTPKSFQPSSQDQALAELGFIVITVDGMGTAMRSKAFHNVSYKNLGDSGLEDHIQAIKELAVKYSWTDIDRVGIYGHSAGGYDSAHAMLTHPEFYKVAVSSSGCHDNRSDKVWWNELWMGYPVSPHYREQANPTLAANLKGKLLLVHGDLDDNVHPAATLQLVEALIKANKDFDLLIIPNKRHNLGNGYFIRKRWDYFVKHLLGVEPPKEYPLFDPADRQN